MRGGSEEGARAILQAACTGLELFSLKVPVHDHDRRRRAAPLPCNTMCSIDVAGRVAVGRGAQLPGTSVACPAVEQKRFEALVEQLNSARTCVETGGRDGVREWNEGRERWRKCPAGGRTEWRAAGRELRGEQVAALWINRFGRVFECWRITAIQRTYALRQ